MTFSKTIGVLFLLTLTANAVLAQSLQPIYVIDKPTAGILPDRSYNLMGRTGPESSFLVDARLGMWDRVQVGISYGMQQVFSHDHVTFNDLPGLNARVRIVDEMKWPAIALGFDNQGQGYYHKDLERYDRKSLGFYAVASKNWAFKLGEFSLHGGTNYSLENSDDSSVNVFVGGDWLVFHRLSFLLDADAGLNDNGSESFGEGGAYVDAGLRFFFMESFSASLYFRDLTGNFGPQRNVGREFELAFLNFF
jgi:hypothetical protein